MRISIHIFFIEKLSLYNNVLKKIVECVVHVYYFQLDKFNIHM